MYLCALESYFNSQMNRMQIHLNFPNFHSRRANKFNLNMREFLSEHITQYLSPEPGKK